MPNRRLTPDELVKANELLATVRTTLIELSSGYSELLWSGIPDNSERQMEKGERCNMRRKPR